MGEGCSRKPTHYEHLSPFPFGSSGAYLQDFPLEIFQRLRLDTSANDAGEAQQAHHGLHICTLSNELVNRSELRRDIV